jgi:hypothetical protein
VAGHVCGAAGVLGEEGEQLLRTLREHQCDKTRD